MQQQPKRRWSNGWYGLALMLALLVFGLRGLDSKIDGRHQNRFDLVGVCEVGTESNPGLKKNRPRWGGLYQQAG